MPLPLYYEEVNLILFDADSDSEDENFVGNDGDLANPQTSGDHDNQSEESLSSSDEDVQGKK